MEKPPGKLTLLSLLKPLNPKYSRQIFQDPELEEVERLHSVAGIRAFYKDEWVWGAGAEYLYRALIQALDLEKYEEQLIRIARRKGGRKKETELATRIWKMKAEGKTAPQMKAIFEAEGQYFSLEKIESYLKTRRKKQAK